MFFIRMIFAAAATVMVAFPTEAGAENLSIPEFAASAASYERRIVEVVRKRGVDPVVALGRAKKARVLNKSGQEVAELEAVAGANPSSFPVWLRLAKAWLSAAPLSGDAASAAYATYTKATLPDQKAEGLLLLADLLTSQMPLLKKAKDEAELKISNVEGDGQSGSAAEQAERIKLLEEQARISADYERRYEKTATHAFAVYDKLFTVLRSQAAAAAVISARTGEGAAIFGPKRDHFLWKINEKAAVACLDFNSSLKPDAKLYQKEFVKVFTVAEQGGKKLATPLAEPIEVTVQREELCIHGFSFGQVYQISLLDGLPSETGLLMSEKIFQLTAPNRPASISFQGAAYIVPSHTEKSVPVSTINVERLKLDLIRISDRNVHQKIALKQLSANLKGKDLLSLYRDFGEKLWSGEKVLPPKPNQVVHTELPMAKIIAERQSWIRSPNRARTPIKLGIADDAFANGAFVQDPAASQSSGSPLWEPGVYAVVGRVSEEEKTFASLMDSNAQDDSVEGLDTAFPVQWFIFTDLGLSFYQSDTRLYVAARSLATGEKVPGARIELVAANNRVLASQETDDNGIATFEGRLANGELGNRLAAITIYKNQDFAFLDFSRDVFDLSNHGVSGREAPKGYDAYVYSDRGVYRPNPDQPINAIVLIRDKNGRAPVLTEPLTVSLVGRNGLDIETKKVSAAKLNAAGGGTNVTFRPPESLPLGAADIVVRVGDQKKPIGSTVVQIKHFRADQARLNFLTLPEWRRTIADEGKLDIGGRVTAQYLYGRRTQDGLIDDAPAAGLFGDLEVLLERADAPFGDCSKGFVFGQNDEAFKPFLSQRRIGPSTEDGGFDVSETVTGVPDAGFPLQAKLTLSLLDASGTIASKSEILPLTHSRSFLGLRQRSILPGAGGKLRVEFDTLAIDQTQQPRKSGFVKFKLQSEQQEFIWFESYEGWRYRAAASRQDLQNGEAEIQTNTACGQSNAQLPAFDLAPGAYLLEVWDEGGARTSLRFEAGSASAAGKRPEPQVLTVRASKPDKDYAPGEDIEFSIESPFDGVVQVGIAGDGVIEQWISAQTKDRKATVRIAAPKVWAGRNFYAIATVFRPGAGESAVAWPARALGVAGFSVSQNPNRLSISLDGTPFRIIPSADLALRLRASTWNGEKLNGKAFIAVQAVDEGLLNLTSHPAAAPSEYFFGQKRLTFSLYDSYGRILLSRSGGDAYARYFARLSLNNYLSEKIVSYTTPEPVEIEFRDGIATPHFTSRFFRDFAGSLRVTAIVWSGDKVGSAQKDVIVKDTFISRLGAPRFLAAGDKPVIPLFIHNVEGAAGNYKITVAGAAIKSAVGGEIIEQSPGDDWVKLRLSENGRAVVQLAVNVPEVTQRSSLTVNIEGDADNPVNIERNWTIPMRDPETPVVVLAVAKLLSPNQELVIDRSLVPRELQAGYAEHSVQVQFSEDALPFAVATPGVLPTGAVTLERLVWNGMLMLQAEGGSEPSGELTSTLRDLAALQEKSGHFMPYSEKQNSSENVTSVPALFEEEPADKVWRTALALDVIRQASRLYPVYLEDFSAVISAGRTYLAQKTPELLSPPDEYESQGALRAQAEREDDQPTDQTIQEPIALDTGAADVTLSPSPEVVEESPEEAEKSENAGEEGEEEAGAEESESVCSDGLAYATFVQAAFNDITLDTLQKIQKVCAVDEASLLSRAIVAAALSEFGKREDGKLILASFGEAFKSEEEIEKRNTDRDYAAMFLSFIAKTDRSAPEAAEVLKSFVQEAKQGVTISLAARSWLSRFTVDSRQETGALVKIEADAIPADSDSVMEVVRPQLAATRFFPAKALASNPVKVRNKGPKAVTAKVFVRGVPLKRRDGQTKGLTVKRRYFDASGAEFDASTTAFRQNQVVFVMVEGVSAEEALVENKVLIVDLLPSGFEIVEADAYKTSARSGEGFDITASLPEAIGKLAHSEQRDDKYIAVVEPEDGKFLVGYIARAVTVGEFVVPTVTVEDLQSPQFITHSEPVRKLTIQSE